MSIASMLGIAVILYLLPSWFKAHVNKVHFVHWQGLLHDFIPHERDFQTTTLLIVPAADFNM